MCIRDRSVFKWRNCITPLITKRFDWLVALYTFLYILGMTLYCYRELPVFDFRPYHIGADIRKGMEIPEGAQPLSLIHILLPQGKQQTSAKPLTRVIIDKNLNFYTAFGNQDEMPIELEELPAFLQECAQKEPDMYVALYADEAVPYREIVRVLNIANENHFKMVLATRPPEKKR